MLRMTLILCIGMYAALMIAGVDRGQLRPGLADAAARAARVGTSDVTAGDSADVALAAPATSAASVAEPVVTQPVETAAVAPAAVAEPVDTAVAEPLATPARSDVTDVEEPVFSLASVGNEAVPAAPAEDAAAAPEVAEGGRGTIWYVNASSVNVRAEPSTEAAVVGRLGSGEATLLVQTVDDDWARIVIQGDGVEGFVAMRYLSAEAP